MLLVGSCWSTAHAQCDEVTQGTPPEASACFACPFPASLSGNNAFATPTGGGSWCTTIENDQFIGFTAICNAVSFTVQVSNCAGGSNGDGLQMAIVDADFNVFNCTSGIANGATFAATLPTCGNYYIRLDGLSGSGCDYTISPVSGVLDENFVAPTAAGTISGPPTLCEGQGGGYLYQAPMSSVCGGAAVCSDLCWDISFSSPLLASGVSFDPSDAFGFGCSESGVTSVNIMVDDLSSLPPGSTETIFLSATPSFGCLGPGTQSQVFEIVVTRPPDQFATEFTCPGEDFIFDNTPYSPGNHFIDQTDANGCPFTLNLMVQSYPPSFGPTIPLAVCAGANVTICPDNPIVNPLPGLQSCALTDQAATGCDSIITYDVYYLDPQAVVSAPDTSLDCTQSDLTLSVAPGSSQGDTVRYAWTSNGPSFTVSADTQSITVTEAGTYVLTVTLAGSQDPTQTCTASDTVVVTSDAGTPLAAPLLAGLTGVCIGDNATYSTPSSAAIDTYQWSSNGATPANGSGPSYAVNWPNAGTYEVCLTVANACSTSDPTCIDVTVGDDQPSFTLEGATTACSGGAIVLGITPFATTATYTVTQRPAGSVATVDADSVRIQLGSNPGQLCITGQGNCGGATEVCVDLTLSTSAAAPVVSGPGSVCAGSTEAYTITADPLITSATWSAAGGIVLSQNTSGATVEWSNGGSGQVCVDIVDACGVQQQNCLPVNVSAAPTAAIRGGGDYCVGQNNVEVAIDLTGNAPFTLVYTFNGVQQTEVVTASPFIISAPAPGTYRLVSVTSDAGCMAAATGSVEVTELNAPSGSMTGTFDICEGATTPVQLPVSLSGTAPFLLQFAIDGVAQPVVTTSDNPYLLDALAAGTYSLASITDASGCMGSGTSSATLVERAAVELVSVDEECQAGAGTYVVTVVLNAGDAASYQNTGATAGTFAGNTFTSIALANGTGYDFVFSDQFGCNSIPVNRPVVQCNCDNSAGTMDRDEAYICGPGTINLDPATSGAGAVSQTGDVLMFYLHTSPTASLQNALDSNATPSFTFDPARYTLDQEYFVSAVSGNDAGTGFPDRLDPCLDVAIGQPVRWRSLPSALLGAVTPACVGDNTLIEIIFIGTPPYEVAYELGGIAGSESFSSSGQNLALVTPATTTSLVGTTVTDVYGCEGNATGQVDITPLPSLSVTDVDRLCDGTGTSYTVSFTIVGGDRASLMVSPAGSGSLVNGDFTSTPISSGSGYNFQVTDVNGCDVIEVSATTFDCACATSVAPIAQDLISTCGPNTVTLTHSHASSTLDANDVTGYVLHDAPGGTIGNIFARTTVPVFDFDAGAGMVLGQTYYASPVAGDNDGTGRVLLSDPCVAIASGQPLVWTQGPAGELSDDIILCETGEATITLILTGPGPFDATLTTDDSGVASDVQLTGIQSGQTFVFSPSASTYYVLSELSNSDCTVFPNDTINIQVDQLVNAGTATAVEERCAEDGAAIELSTLHTGQTGGGDYRFVSGPQSPILDIASGSFVNTGLAPGAYTFEYFVGDGGACPSDTEELNVTLRPQPTADAGEDLELNCRDSVVIIGGPNSSNDPGLLVTWSGGTFTDPSQLTQSVMEAGTYVLTISDASGQCTDTDEVEVEAGPGRITEVSTLVGAVDCDGGATGSILVEAPVGGEAPYTYSLNEDVARPNGLFAGLAPGDYTITVTDANGCRFDRRLTLDAPQAIGVDAGPNLEIRFGESPQLDLIVSAAVETVTWTGGPVTCLNDNCTSVTLDAESTTNYNVLVEDSNGCTASTSLQVIVRRERPVFIPTGFSPNGDGSNEVFFVQAPEGVVAVINSFEVYDRWGEAVYIRRNLLPNDPSSGWDGKGDGQLHNPGVFVYVVELEYSDGVVETLTGDVTLMR